MEKFMINLTIPIECGKEVCFDETGVHCRFNLLHLPEHEYTCELFEVMLYHEYRGASNQSTPMRCIQCKEAGKSSVIDVPSDELSDMYQNPNKRGAYKRKTNTDKKDRTNFYESLERLNQLARGKVND
jgi:hypothetical protein